MGFLTTFLFSCWKNTKLTNKEVKLCEIVEIDQNLAKTIKELTNKPIQLIPEFNETGEVLDTKSKGLCSLTEAEKCYDYVFKLKEKFKSKEILVFAFEDNQKRMYLGAIKGTNELDIVKWRQTNGINYGHENKDVLAKLKEWKQHNDFFILGVGIDFLELKFVSMPSDIERFSKDVYQFCPDIVDQSTGELKNLHDEIIRTHGLYLWWD